MGCSESKNSVATGNTITQSKKPSAARAGPVDEPMKVDSVEKAVVPLENKASEGDAGMKEVTRDAEVASEVEKKDDATKENEEKPEKADQHVKEEKAVEEKEPEKENGSKEVANNEEGSIKEVEQAPATPSPAVAETESAIVSKESNPPEKKE